jgi:lysyl-tRNA synthetase class 2
MAIDTLVRIIDVHASPTSCTVVYAIEDRETQTLWQGDPPGIGDVYLIDTTHPGKDARKISGPEPGRWMPDNDALRWRKPVSPTSGISRMEILRRRHKIRRAVQAYFDSQGFVEIEAPLLVHGASPDIAVDAFVVGERYLVTSTEYQLKRMAIGGFNRIYSLTKNFRKGDNSRVRNPEFTMLEWGRVGEDMRGIEADAEALVSTALDALQLSPVISYQGEKIDLTPPWERMPVLEAIRRFTGASVLNFEAPSLRKAAEAAGLEIRAGWAENKGFLFSLLMDHIQPSLGAERPVFLTEWPLFETTSASLDPNDPTLARRSELFVAGVELSDGFAGLADTDLQAQLFQQALAARAQEGMEQVALDEKYLAAMRLGSPFGAGMALGFDRLVMLLTDQPTIGGVLAFGWDEV